jgi:hypothetical protein
MNFKPLIFIFFIECTHLCSEVLLRQVQSLLQSLTLRFILHILIPELHHLPAKSLKLNLLSPSLLLNNHRYTQRFRQSALQLILMRKEEVSFFDKFGDLRMQEIKGLGFSRGFLHLCGAIFIEGVEVSAEQGHLIEECMVFLSQ